MKENPIRSLPGIPMLLFLLAVCVAAVWMFANAVHQQMPVFIVEAILIGTVALFCMAGLYTVQPNQAAVISLFGKYVGTVKENGLRWNNPFFS